MNESGKSNFDIFIESHQPKEGIKKQYLNDWSHLHLSQEPHPLSFPKIIIKHPQTTKTTLGIISVLLPESSKSSNSISKKSSSIIFYSTLSSQNTPEINLSEIKKAVILEYSARFPKMKLKISVDLKPSIYSFSKEISKDLTKRTLVHLISDLLPDFNSQPLKDSQFRQLSDIIRSTLHCGVHIIDCDKAGLYYPCYQEIFKEAEFTMQHQNLFVFFSCLENQKVPKLPGLPNDLFSSFLISPAKTALLCHSWHYFCFNHSMYSNLNDDSILNAPSVPPQGKDQHDEGLFQLFFRSSLLPLTVEQVASCPKSLIDNLMVSLRRIVEAMVCECDDFSLFFRMDETVADFFTGFAIAQHVFSSFQVKPFSYPAFPDSVVNHPLWSTFDLRLDAVLMTLVYGSAIKNGEGDLGSFFDGPKLSELYSVENIPFSEQELSTIKLLIESKSPLSTFAGHIAFLPSCLADRNLMKESVSTLTNFFDETGLEGIQMAAKFPIFPALVQIAKSKASESGNGVIEIDDSIDVDQLIFCMSKLYFFYPNANDLVPFFNIQYLKSFTVSHLRSKRPLPTIVFVTLMLKLGNVNTTSLFLKCNWMSITECLIQSPSENVRIWTLFFVSSFAKFIVLDDQILQLIDAISNAADDNSPLVRVAFLVAMQSISLSNSQHIESAVLELSLKLLTDLHPAVRRELAILLVSMKLNHMQKANSFDDKSVIAEKMANQRSNSMSTSDFFSESSSDMDIAASEKYEETKQKANIGSFSYSTKSEINKLIRDPKDACETSDGNQSLIMSALKLLATDPFDQVKKTALEVQKNVTFMHFFDIYISSKFKDADVSSFSSSRVAQKEANGEATLTRSTLTKLSSKGEFSRISLPDLKRAKIENIFSTKSIAVNSNQIITSNIAFSPIDEKLIFAAKGQIISLSSQQEASIVQGFVSQSPITHVHCFRNNGFPIILISNHLGEFFACQINSSKPYKLNMLTSFKVFLHSSKSQISTQSPVRPSCSSTSSFIKDLKEPENNNYEFEFISQTSKLCFYVPKTGYKINVYDLNADKKIGEIASSYDNITNVHSPSSYLADCLLVCDEELLLYDCRASFSQPVLTYQTDNSSSRFSKVYNCKSFKKEPFLIPICTSGGSVLYNDLRMMGPDSSNRAGVRKLVAYDFPFNDAQALCFDVNQETLTTVMGSTKGASAFLYPYDRKILFPNKQKLAQPIFKLKWMPSKFGLVMMPSLTEIQSCYFS